MSPIEDRGTDCCRHIRRYKQPIWTTSRIIRHLTTYISFIRLHGPNAQCNFVHLLAASSAIKRVLNFRHGPYNGPAEQALMNTLPRWCIGFLVTVVVSNQHLILSLWRSDD